MSTQLISCQKSVSNATDGSSSQIVAHQIIVASIGSPVFSENSQLEFFDSFGLPPDVYEGVVPFLHAQGWPSEECDATYNDEQIQSIDSDACGHYCILFGHFRARGVAYADILRHLNDIHSFSRDTIVKLIVNLVL